MNEIGKHYLITGGAGFIGSRLIKALLAKENIRITCIDNFDPFYKKEIKKHNIQAFEGNDQFTLLSLNLDHVTVPELLHAITSPVDIIIHLAARAGVRPSIDNPLGYEQTNIMGTQKLLDFAVQANVKRFVFASSSSVYGVNEKLPWSEGEALMPISPYAMTKLAGEMAGHVYHKLYALPFIALRFFTVYGPSQRPDLAIHKFTKAIISGAPIAMYGDGSTSRDYTFIDDIVSGIIAATEYSDTSFEIINLGNNYTVSLKNLIANLEEVIGKKAVIDQQPEQPGDVPHTFADISKAQRLLKYEPKTTLQSGLKQFYQWFSENENLLKG